MTLTEQLQPPTEASDLDVVYEALKRIHSTDAIELFWKHVIDEVMRGASVTTVDNGNGTFSHTITFAISDDASSY